MTGIGFDAELELLRRETRHVLAEKFAMQRVRASLDPPPDRAFLDESARLGWSGALVATQHGGGGLSLIQTSVVAEEHGRALFPASLESSAAVSVLIGGWATDAQRARVLPLLVGGGGVVVWAGAGEAGGHEQSPAITASPASGGGVRLDGVARLVHDAQVCDMLVVSARRSGDGGAVHALVAATHPGVARMPVTTLDVSRHYARVELHSVEVAAPDVIDDLDGDAQRRMLDVATVLACADAKGSARALADMTVRYAMGRSTFGRPIASYQAIKHKCADMLVAVEGCEVVTRYAALAVDANDARAATAVSMAKAYVSDAASMVAGESQQIHGGIGFTWEHDVHLHVRRIKANAVVFGSAAWHRERVAAALIRDVSAESR